MIRSVLVVGLLGVSASASAFVFERDAPLSASGYSVAGSGASAELQRVRSIPYTTNSGRSLPIPLSDVIRPGKANIAKNLAKRLLIPGGPAVLAASVLAPAVLSMFSDDGASIQNGAMTRTFTAYRWTSSGQVFAGNGYYENITAACRANYPASLNYQNVYATTAGCAGNSGTCWDGSFRLTANCAINRTTQTQTQTQTMTEAQAEAAVMNEPDTDAGLAPALQHLVDVNHGLTFDGTEAAQLSAAPQETPAYSSSTTTRPDGTTETTSTKDRVETQTQGNTGPVAGNKATTTETKTTTKTTPEGTTTTVAIIDNGAPEEGVTKSCGAAGDQPCTTVEQGTFTAPAAAALPTIPGAKTFEQSTADFMTAVNGSPLFSFVSGLSIPSGGSCPTVPIAIDFLNFSGTFDSHCAIVDQIGPALGSVMLAFWLLVAIRRVMSA